jgi:glycosyltransferase involved in cell wall biosynthesis
MHVSVIIPAYNEADVLPLLLSDLEHQRSVEAEVIVADAASTDDTRQIAEVRGATVVEGGLPAAGRNAGARAASGDLLVFLDADVRLPRRFLARAAREMREKDAVVATCVARPMSHLTADRLIHRFANLFIRMNQDSNPHAPGYCILVRRDVFEEIGGFDEAIRIAEDHDFVSRASAHGKFRLLESTYVKVNVRRFEKEGRIGYSVKAMRIMLHRALHGEITDTDTFDYEFGNYDEDDESTMEKSLRQIEKALLELDHESSKLSDRLTSPETYEKLATDGRRLLREFRGAIGKMADGLFGPNEKP